MIGTFEHGLVKSAGRASSGPVFDFYGLGLYPCNKEKHVFKSLRSWSLKRWYR